MAIVNGIGAVLEGKQYMITLQQALVLIHSSAIIGAIVGLFDIIISCLTCGHSGGRRRRGRTSVV
jgi:hypothetical protein